MEIKEILSRKKQIKTKLMAATSMLLVSSIMLSTTTYAWLTLSTAPEVTDMKTTAGTNGALEIALQSTDNETNTRAEIKSKIGDSTAAGNSPTAANETWGNIVDLADHYGLEGIALSPARLNINTQTSYVSTSSPLTVPEFGGDGRIASLTPMDSLYYDDDTSAFVKGSHYGVTVIGKQDEVNGGGTPITRTMNRQWLIDTSTDRISTMRETMKEKLNTVVGKESKGIVDILRRFFGTPSFVDKDITTIGNLVDGFTDLMGDAKTALRYALLACCAADTINYPGTEQGQKDLSAVYAKYSKLDLKSSTNTDGSESDSIYKIASENQNALEEGSTLYKAYESVLNAVESVDSAEQALSSAKGYVTKAKNNPSDKSPLVSACTAMFNVSNMYVGKTSSKTLYVATSAAAKTAFGPGENELYTVKGSGLFYTMASVVGDYTTSFAATYSIDDIDENGELIIVYRTYTVNLHATTASDSESFDPDYNTGCLQKVYDAAAPLTVDGKVTYTMLASSHMNAYGYMADLAFKCTDNGDLNLQQQAVSRVGNQDSANDRLPESQSTQGSGSNMTFIAADDLSDAQITSLIQNVYVIFMDTQSGAIYGVAGADTDNIKIKTKTDSSTQKDTREVTAQLAMYNTSINDGVLTKTGKSSSQRIVNMTADMPVYITAVVYLNGDSISSSDVSSDVTQSLFGTVNLQFSTNADLEPMDYTGYRTNSQN